MRIDLNLAGSPFRNRSLFWLGMAAASLVAFTAFALVVVRAATVGADAQTLKAERAEQQRTIEELESRVHDIEDAEAHAIFSSGDRRALDDARILLNQRSFSWTRLFTDLEPTVPRDVRLTQIALSDMAGEGAGRVVKLSITGHGKSFGQMAEFIANLDQTGGRFSADPVENGLAKDETEFEFTVDVTYRPAIGSVPAPAAPAPKGEDGDV
jgi:Tfp pilus assembly protein PilN